MNFNHTLEESQLTPFEKALDNADYFITHCYMLNGVQEVIKAWKANMGSWNELDWRNDVHDRETLAEVMKDQKAYGEALIDAANKFEDILGISA